MFYLFLKKYINQMCLKPPDPQNFDVVLKFVTDEAPTSETFIRAVSRSQLELEHDLAKFQSDKPLLPFAFHELLLYYQSLLEKCVMSSVKTAKSLIAVDVTKAENLLYILCNCNHDGVHI